MKRHIHFARKKRQLKGLVKLLKKYTNDSIKYQEILEKTKILFNELKFRLSTQFFKKTFAGLSVGLLMSLGTIKAQTFAAPVTNPFGIDPDGELSYIDITFGDINNNGTLDIIGGSYRNRTFFSFENIGTTTTPLFDSLKLSPYNLPYFDYESNPVLVDIDNDGDLDILAGEYFYDNNSSSYVHGIRYYENIGTNAAPNFAAPVNHPFGLNVSYPYLTPIMVDIDNDGDLDMFAGEYYGDILFFENIGTASNPIFDTAQISPFGIDLSPISPILYYTSPTFADIDDDGDLDMLVGVNDYAYYATKFVYFENIGTASNPIFDTAQIDPFGLDASVYSYRNITPRFVDIDGDGDYDIMMGTSDGDILFYENTTPNSIPLSADTTITIDEDAVYAFTKTDFPFIDSNLLDNFKLLKIEETVNVGSLKLSGSDVSNGQDIAVADIPNLVYAPLADENGNNYDSFTFRVSDGKDFSVDTFTLSINVTAVNDAPESENKTVTTNEDVAYEFSAADFAFNDVDAGDTLTSVKITDLVSVGSLKLSGLEVTLNQDIGVANLTNLVFTPKIGEFGVNYDSFKFSVSDGTASSAEYVMTINVNEVVTGIKSAVEINALSVYPNPVVNSLQVNFENESNEAAILEIYDITGRKVYNNKVSNRGFNEITIDASALQNGAYILKVSIGTKQSNVSFIK